MPDIQTVRDWAIVIVAFFSLVGVLIFIVVGIMLIRLIGQVQRGTQPIMESARRTAETIQGTTVFASDTVVRPIIRVASVAAAVGRFSRVLMRRSGKKKGGG